MDEETLRIARQEAAKTPAQKFNELLSESYRKRNMSAEERHDEAANEAAASPMERVTRKKVEKDISAYKQGWKDGFEGSLFLGLGLVTVFYLLSEYVL